MTLPRATKQGLTPCLAALLCASLQAQTPAQMKQALARALPPIERSLSTFARERACFSCHHNGLGVLALRSAQQSGARVSQTAQAAIEAKTFREFRLENALDQAIEGLSFSDPAPNESFLLLSAAAAKVTSPALALRARRIARWQQNDGHWATSDFRPPHSYSLFTATASAVLAIRGYLPPADPVLIRAGQWLRTHQPHSTEDASFRLLGLTALTDDLQTIAGDLLALQLPSGGWPQIKGYAPDAYSTGQAVVALETAHADAKAIARGIRFLLRTQAPNGTWRTHTRMLSPAMVSPPYFKTGYPYGHDEFLSFAGASWAVMALAGGLPDLNAAPAPLQAPDTLIYQAHDEAAVRRLIASGADVRARTKDNSDPLTAAASYRNNTGTLRALLDAGAIPNPPQDLRVHFTPLVLASMSGDIEAVRLLLARGADPNLGCRSGTPMSQAITFGHTEVVAALIAAGATVDLTESNGINLLHWATLTNRPAVIPLLAKAGVPINAEDDNGFTPLHYAASIDFGDTAVLDALLAAGADKNLRDYDNRTPRQQALRLGHAALARSLARSLKDTAPGR
jgi:ankyrin repeat protein